MTALGQKSVGNAQVVPLLVSLLAVEAPPAPKARSSDEEEDQSNASPDDELDAPEGIRASEDVVRAVVHALSRNNTPQSLAVLKDMLLGKQTAPLALRELVSEIVKALAEDVNHEKEAILAVLLTKPEAITARLTEAEAAGDGASRRGGRGPGRGNAVSDDLGGSGDDTGPLWLQELVLTEAAPATSNRFRSGMARYLQDPEVPAETAELVEQFLVQSDPRNVEAQVILYRIPHTQEQTIQQIEQSLTEGSQRALQQLLGYSSATGDAESDEPPAARSRRPSPNQSAAPRASRPSLRPSRREDPADDELDRDDRTVRSAPQPTEPLEIARLLWTPELVQSLQLTLPTAEDLRASGNSRTALLLATVPLDSAREKLGSLLEQRIDDGPDPWTSAGLFGTDVVDPALLVLAKQAYQKAGGAPYQAKRRARG